ncbi:phospholipase D family protein [Paenibacillus selenitireducens]|uniref:phospholipase D n=1 Tax=Paenibacillus selenitireducens TaxID=1324314 RepID=A0A1T2X454_9BACL|nr:phospholipase D-like domain-containing protein [Paenibacillus selenitireducens]OPA74678.1 phospholipase D family protein [Paenibacillus selenitireducens]
MTKRLELIVSSIVAAILLFGGLAYAQSISSTKINGSQIDWAFTQDNQQPEKLLIDVINSSKKTLDIAIYSLTYPDIVAAIKDAKKRGVAVRIVTDKIQSSGQAQSEALKLLGSAGIPIKINTHAGLMHLKMVVADKKIATTGSFNYSKAASTTNDEVLMVLRDETIAKSFSSEFDKIWADTKKYETLEKKIAQPEGKVSSDKTPSNVAACSKPTIKGNKNSKIYHVPGGKSYDSLTNVELFCSEKDAVAAGYKKAKN